MLPHAMIDFETLNTKNRPAVLSLGAVRFNPFTKEDPFDPFYIRFEIDHQFELGRTYSEDTIAWWERQDPDIRAEAMDPGEDRVTIEEGVKKFHKWYWNKCEGIWGNGAIFDVAILEDLYDMVGQTYSWQYYHVRCARTVFNQGIDPKRTGNDLHNALADAYDQALGIQNVYAELGIESERGYKV